MARHDALVASMVTAMKAGTNTAAMRQLQSDAIRAELAWPGSKALVPPPAGNQFLTLQQLNALAIGPNT